ncbi:MAG TPA: hypothetical protein VHU89_04915 [Acidobacteriaceae bacterium]|jgi:hypothetical protein|nr:hypothetical protein [Acidobacteriaceae bacterium]
MISERHPLRQLFHEVVAGCYSRYSGITDPELTTYVGDLLTEFTASENLYRIRDADGRPLTGVQAMVAASDPVFGAASSFDEERKVRRHIGDYALFATGMYPETAQLWRHTAEAGMTELVRTGKESYYIVSTFDLFEYRDEAPLFARLSENFERCMHGLTKVREELDRMGGSGMIQ